jgi:hypothetical protein
VGLARHLLDVYSYELSEKLEHPVHKSYNAMSGYLREEAIMVLRRFYITENENGAADRTLFERSTADVASSSGAEVEEESRAQDADTIFPFKLVDAGGPGQYTIPGPSHPGSLRRRDGPPAHQRCR